MRPDFLIDNVTPSPLLNVANAFGRRFNTSVARFLQAAGYYPEPVVFGGYASASQVRIMGRVIMSLTFEQRSWLKERRGWRQFFDAQVPFEPIRVCFGDASVVTVADGGGYFDIVLDGHGLPAGWHDVRVQVLNRRDIYELGGLEALPGAGRGVRATSAVSVAVRVVGEGESVGVVSDIDDTIMVSMVPRPIVAARHALLDHVRAREAVPGMSEFLRFLGSGDAEFYAADAMSAGRAVQVYLSTGAWNTLPVLRDFVVRVRYPRGAFLMTDFGPSNTGWFRSGKEHKRRELRRLVEFFPNVRWFLVGDDGQRDPQIYAEFARDFPDRVAGIAIRSLSPVEMFLTHGTPQAIVPDALHDVPDCVPVWVGQDGYSLLDQVRGALS